jgi:thioredoxin-related protein
MFGLPQGQTGFAGGDDDALGLRLVHDLGFSEVKVVVRGLRTLALILSWLPPALGAATGIAPARDLAVDAREMRARGSVMLVLYSQADCRWCERAKHEVLIPLQNDPASRGRVVLREIALDADHPLADFAGRPTTHRSFAISERARFTPTLIVYGPDGARLAEPIVGFRIADFYAEYVNRAIEEGLTRIGSPSRGR